VITDDDSAVGGQRIGAGPFAPGRVPTRPPGCHRPGRALVFAVLLGSDVGYSWPRSLVGMVFVLVLLATRSSRRCSPDDQPERARTRVSASAYSPGTIERFGLSFAFSLALLPILAVAHGLPGIPSRRPPSPPASPSWWSRSLSSVSSGGPRYRRATGTACPAARLRRADLDWLAAGTATDTVLSAVPPSPSCWPSGSLCVRADGPDPGRVLHQRLARH